ncbi:MAG TPA: thiamine-phosphate kinase [Candidatus Didemnitutus sp.]|jgi:thiamine-monophosphate kinase
MKLFTSVRSQRVTSLGERRLIGRIRGWLGDVCPPAPFGMGDDCAVLPRPGRSLLITTDPVIAGRHFDGAVPARAVGAKLLKRNLSDIAAMGGTPRTAVVSLALAPATSVAWLRSFYAGLAHCARRHRVKVVGGDVTQALDGFFGAFLTLHGEATAARVITRQGARAGDQLYVTGALGGSRLGHHFTFEPRLREGEWLARRPEIRAMMDLSDGLAKDVRELVPPPLAADLLPDEIPVAADARRWAGRTGGSPLEHALRDGEDYELLIVVDGRRSADGLLKNWRRHFPRLPLTRIGSIVRGSSAKYRLGANLLADGGFEHLRPDSARARSR